MRTSRDETVRYDRSGVTRQRLGIDSSGDLRLCKIETCTTREFRSTTLLSTSSRKRNARLLTHLGRRKEKIYALSKGFQAHVFRMQISGDFSLNDDISAILTAEQLPSEILFLPSFEGAFRASDRRGDFKKSFVQLRAMT